MLAAGVGWVSGVGRGGRAPSERPSSAKCFVQERIGTVADEGLVNRDFEPETVARRAAAVLDAQGDDDKPGGRVRNQAAGSTSNGASNRREDTGSAPDAREP